MKKLLFIFVLALIADLFTSCKNHPDNKIKLEELRNPVEVIRDKWGINHIYAANTHDLFFMQGYLAAKDRLFQFEIWRRQATGTIAEILGPKEIKRDIGTRLFIFRGDMNTGMEHYHPEGKEIIHAYTDGVNRYIAEILENPENLPIEFKLLNIKPKPWTPEVVISRHQGLLGNIKRELNTGRAVAKIGTEKVRKLMWFHPKKPKLELDPAITSELLDEDILGLYNAYRKKVQFLPSDIDPAYRNQDLAANMLNQDILNTDEKESGLSIGSNNWIVSGKLTDNGSTVMANDPHRTIAIPSLRYMIHLVAPGWNVIGAGEPEIPGVSIGHNEYGAWGLTVFKTDGEDLLMYELNPDDPDQYKYKGEWKSMKIIHETIKVKDSKDVDVDLKYTIHGPVCYIDTLRHKAWAVRCAWMEPGGAPYLASLRMDQTKSWEEFREACSFSNIPGENMVWADKEGNIGWQAVGIAPVRKNYSGMVPVPGDGRFEWDGYLPIIEKPNVTNPEKGFFASANQNITPETYTHWDAIGYYWSDPYRGNRLNEVLGSGKKLSMKDMKALQNDYYSLPAKALMPFLKNIRFESQQAVQAQNLLLEWDLVLNKTSIAAGIYNEWENQLMKAAKEQFIPEEVQGLISFQLTRLISWINDPEKIFPAPPEKNRDHFLKETFLKSLDALTIRLGENMDNWQLGQEKYKHIIIYHALSKAVNNDLKEKLNTATAIRGGNAYCPAVTDSTLNQTRGASFRIIVNTGDWDAALAINTPGQSGNPDSPFYKSLFDLWANDGYFPLYYSKEKIEEVTASESVYYPE
jgi:penicillin amidase